MSGCFKIIENLKVKLLQENKSGSSICLINSQGRGIYNRVSSVNI